MAAAKRRMQTSLKNVKRSRENDDEAEVFAGQTLVEEGAADGRQTRERLAEYFAILREWDLRLRQNESQDVPEFRPS